MLASACDITFLDLNIRFARGGRIIALTGWSLGGYLLLVGRDASGHPTRVGDPSYTGLRPQKYRGTSPIRNNPPHSRINIGP